MSDAAAPAGLPREYGFWTGVFVVVASMVGVGILSSPGYMIKDTESHSTLLWVWTIGGVLSMCGSLTLAELATAMPKVGGEYVFVRAAFGPATAFLFGWATLWVSFAGPTAVISHLAVEYLAKPIPALQFEAWPGWLTPFFASILVAFFTWSHCLGYRESAWVQNSTTLFKLLTLGLFAIVGIAFGTGDWSHFAAGKSVADQRPTLLAALLVYVMYGYSGWNGAVYLSGEIQNPPKLVPRCIIGGCLLVTLLYLLMNVAYGYAIAPDGLAMTDTATVKRVGYIAAEKLFGETVSRYLSVIIGLGILSSISAYILTGPRVSFAMARDGLFPRYAGRAHATRNTPVAAIVTQGVATMVLLWGGQYLAGGRDAFEQLLNYVSVGLVALGGLTVACIFPLRRREMHRPFRVPLYPLPPLLFILMTAWMVLYTIYEAPGASLLSLGSLLIAYPIYWLFVRPDGVNEQTWDSGSRPNGSD